MSHASYYPGAEPMSLKLLFDPDDGTILGAQAVGGDGVDKRIDVLATAMAAGLHADALADLELAYAPPFSSAKDPVNMLGYMAENVLSGECDVVEPDELDDVLTAQAGHSSMSALRQEHARDPSPHSINLPLDSLRDDIPSAGEGPFVVYCEVGQRGHTATSLLHELGMKARNLDGGYRTWLAARRCPCREPGSIERGSEATSAVHRVAPGLPTPNPAGKHELGGIARRLADRSQNDLVRQLEFGELHELARPGCGAAWQRACFGTIKP